MPKKLEEAVYRVHTDKKIAALTFDIGWGTKIPGPVLDVLRRKRVKHATFFIAGPWAAKNPQMARWIKNAGYEIGSHGALHENYSKYSDQWIEKQVKSAERSIYRATGVRTRLIRTPNGDHNRRVLKKLHQMGYNVVQWDTDSLDWTNPGVKRIEDRVLGSVHPGDIILMHASDTCRQTVSALPRIIDGLRRKGYRLVTVSTIIGMIERML